jgi:hypothetical protein
MATVVLQYAGAAIGTAFGGPIGGIIGRAVGAVAGNVIDQRLFGGGTRRIEGPRLESLRVMASEEGAPVPDVYGRMRVSGQVIWALPIEEVVETSTEKQSSKGSRPKTSLTEYSYFASFAVGLCEGEAAYVGRVWADGREIDLQAYTHRFYTGSEAQQPDSLIETAEGEGKTPAYRGLTYIVFERMPLQRFGNRLPQLSFEVWRVGNSAASLIRGLTIIPGSTEFGYARGIVTRETSEGVTESENAHASTVRSDWDVSMDQMQGLCPNLDAASLVVSWFGTDLRCGECELKPGVEANAKSTSPLTWSVNGVGRSGAHLVSMVDGGPAYGGTPSDSSVVSAIKDMKARGLKVVFYPFILMDVPQNNAKPDPYGAAIQGAYPWRGRITLAHAPGEVGSSDKTAGAATEIASFVGSAQPQHFAISGETVTYNGPGEWSYRRMILHYAKLCAAAGGVDTFLIGSELRGLTTLRSSQSAFPFVTALRDLASEVRAILPSAKISYAADWSEYFGYHPQDGSNDVYFHLDPLWSSTHIDFIGIDNYMPLSDWREGRHHSDFEQGNRSIANIDYLRSNIAGGEGFDWYYASGTARQNQIRTPITDWVFRYKDIKSWWQNAHFNRPGGLAAASQTAWIPQSKPVWFTEAGCPAVDKGPNSPNLFYDAKSSESGYPPFSSGARDDLIQSRYIKALQSFWNASSSHNPISSVYGKKMVDATRIFYWTWDSRPFPAFPVLDQVWSDGPNYEKGHWLTGRIASVDLGDLIVAIAAKSGCTDVDVSDVEGLVDGYVIDRPMSARAALQDLMTIFSVDAVESNGKLVFVSRKAAQDRTIALASLIDTEEPQITRVRAQESEFPYRISLLHADSSGDYRTATVHAARIGAASLNETTVALAAAMPQSTAQAGVAVMLEEVWTSRETAKFGLTQEVLDLDPGDVVVMQDGERWRVTSIKDSDMRRIEASRDAPNIYESSAAAGRIIAARPLGIAGKPLVIPMDLAFSAGGTTNAPWFACFAKPWPGALTLHRKSGADSFAFNRVIEARATLGVTLTSLPQGLLNRLNNTHDLEIELSHGAVFSVNHQQLLNGANVALVGTPQSGFEIIQFAMASLIGPKQYRLSGLLRGLAGSRAEMLGLREPGQRIMLFNSAVVQASLPSALQGLEQTWRVGPQGKDVSDPSYCELTFDPKLLPLRPLAPAQLRARRDPAGLLLSWIRQTRIDGDIWEALEVPLGETSETYSLEILNGANVVRHETLLAPNFVYQAAAITQDFGTNPSSLAFRVAQVSAAFGAGTKAQRTFNV